MDDKNIKYLCQFRTLNFKLPIETGRWQGVNRENRVCTICNTGDIGDEFHYIMTCTFFEYHRKQFIKKRYIKRPNVIKFKEIMNCTNVAEMNNLCKFIKIMITKLNSPG